MNNWFDIRCMPRWFWLPCLLGFIGSLWGSYLFFHHGEGITLIFHAYNTKGEAIETARLTGPISEISRQEVKGSSCLLTRNVGSRLELIFENGKEKKTETVTWLSLQKYQEQYESIIQKQCETMKVPYNATDWIKVSNMIKSHGKGNKYDYPIVFSDSYSQK
jgi:hypothetical protein